MALALKGSFSFRDETLKMFFFYFADDKRFVSPDIKHISHLYLRGDGSGGREELELTLLQLLVERGLGANDGLHDLVGLHLVLLLHILFLPLLLLLVGVAATCYTTPESYGSVPIA